MSDFRLRLETADGQLVANRKADAACFYTVRGFDKKFAELSLTRDCNEKGVKWVSYTADKVTGLHAIVQWLK